MNFCSEERHKYSAARNENGDTIENRIKILQAKLGSTITRLSFSYCEHYKVSNCMQRN